MELRKAVKNTIFKILGILAVIVFAVVVFPAILKTIAMIAVIGAITFVIWLLTYIATGSFKE